MLTERWFELPEIVLEHPEQCRLRSDLFERKFDNYIIAAGRRSFKTERFLKRYFVQQALEREKQTMYLGAPTRMQAKEIFWNDLKALSPKYLVKKIYETELRIKYKNISEIKVVGLDAFERVQGGRAHFVGLTEFQECDPAVYNQTFEPMLNDTGGIFIGEGRPLGKNHLYDFYLKGINKEDGWGAYSWKSSDILTAKQIQRAKSNLAAGDYAREYDASFETEYGNPYHAFTELNVKQFTPDLTLPIIVACDFNATDKPMSWVIGQKVNENSLDVVYWFKCFSQQFTHTRMMCEIVDEYFHTLAKYPVALYFYGDYAGNRKESNSTQSDWEIIEDYFFGKTNYRKFVRPCRSIRNSIASTNARFCNSLGQRKQFVHPTECRALVADLQKCAWKANSRELEDKDPLRGHASRAIDYFNDYEYPITNNNNTLSIT